MKYVRLRFNKKDYSQLEKNANSANMRLNRYLQEEVLNKKSEPYYFYNFIIVLLESISEDIKKNKYNENMQKTEQIGH